jgi:hypothetical protein
MDIEMREKKTGHAVASPSQLYRIMACPGSLFEALKAPISPPSSYALDGTHKHEITSGLILSKPEAKVLFDKLEIEDKNAVEDCLDFAKDLFGKYENPHIEIEKRVTLESWDLASIWGTLDLSVATPKVVHIADWKFGSGVQVFVQDNEQLLAYAAGKVGYHSDTNFNCDIFMHIVQPHINHFDTTHITYADLQNWVFESLEPALNRAEQEDAPYFPGEKQCKFCPSAMTCRARLTAAQETARDVFRIHSKLAITTKDELATILQRIRAINKYASQIEAYAVAELAHGRGFPGFKMVSGRSTRKWANEDSAEAWLLGNSGIKEGDLFNKKFISPAQAEKLDRHLKKNDDFKKLVDKPPGKPKMVDEGDKRAAIDPSAEAAKAFEGWQDQEEEGA